jgi:vanillate O-demethylase ferredoxin subunit
MHDQINAGDVLQISEPRNHFPLVHAPKTLLLAGGIGATPLLCMAQRLHKTGAAFEMHYCTRSQDRTAFRDEIDTSPFAPNVHFHYDDGGAEQKLNLTSVIAKLPPGMHLYMCGPTGFIDWVTKTAADNGWPPNQVHREYFGAAPQDTSGDQAFPVTIASSGAVFDIPANKTVIEALAPHGIDILTSCEQGVCGTCITRVLEGECDHRDNYFTDDEKATHDQFTPCCSRAKTKMLVLDL